MLPQLLRGPREPAAAHAATAAAAPGPQAAAAGLTRCLTERFHIHRVVVIAVCRSIGSRPRPDAAVAAADGGDLVGVTAAAHAEEGQAAAGDSDTTKRSADSNTETKVIIVPIYFYEK